MSRARGLFAALDPHENSVVSRGNNCLMRLPSVFGRFARMVICLGLVPGHCLCGGPVPGLNANQGKGTSHASAPQVTLTIARWEQVHARIAACRGQVLVIDAWSTGCPPCLKEFPKFVALHKKYGERGVKCISFNNDYDGLPAKPPEHYREEILQFLTRQGATCENFLNSEPHEKWLDRIDLGSLPAVFVYGRDGKLARRFDTSTLKTGQKDSHYTEVEKLVEQLLRSPASSSSAAPVPLPR